MGYNRENYRRIRAEFENKYKKAREEADRRQREIWDVLPEIKTLDAELGRVGLEIMGAVMAPGGDVEALVSKIRRKNECLQEKREAILKKSGYPADYSDVHYDCPLCCDSGYKNERMCECMRRELILAGCESSGIGQLMREQNFDNFSLDYYSKNIDTYSEMENVLTTVYRFANNFTEKDMGNLAFIGGTGLGKTHLSSAIARCVIERGYDVVYVSAQGMISDFEHERFGNGGKTDSGEIERYFNCDLLIIDDLGTEVTNQFTVSCLYNVINTRLNTKKSTVISANLKQDELRQRYTDRITSRLLGEYRILRFVGTDIRAQKLSRKKS